ncbi:MAG: ATP-grasp domain-containing protein [Clostridiales bacterium]|nr:ATP-grasp domain-containing protein [Clostridiales bacterium]
MSKVLMVLGASFPQAKLIEAAKRLGYKTIVASIPGEYPGLQVADQVEYVDISDPEAVLEAAKKNNVDGVATCCLDTGIRALGYVCEKMGLPGLSAVSAQRCNDKLMMKKAFKEYGVTSARYEEVTNLEELLSAAGDLGYPIVLKALNQQGSKGVYICHDEAELRDSYANLQSIVEAPLCIVEEYISGYELGAQAFVYQGEILYILPHGDNTYMSRTAVPIGHYVPLGISQELYDTAVVECEKAIRSMGLDNCAVNIDLIAKDGKIYLIELTGRAGATCLPEIMSLYFDFDYYEMIAYTAVGGNAKEFFAKKSDKKPGVAARMMLSEVSGVVKSVSYDEDLVKDPRVKDFSLIIHKGSQVNAFTNAKDRIGQIVTVGDTYEECDKLINDIEKSLVIEFE